MLFCLLRREWLREFKNSVAGGRGRFHRGRRGGTEGTEMICLLRREFNKLGILRTFFTTQKKTKELIPGLNLHSDAYPFTEAAPVFFFVTCSAKATTINTAKARPPG